MHPIRRRKKRPNYGIRTVEVSRGKNGFGFTISGQQPCILSCIVAGSPAEKAGLRPGDYLVAVNSQSVSKVPHDDVVRMIGGSSGILNLQIAENYYSDSSDEDVILPTRPKPRYIHKPRQHHRGTTTQQSRAAKVVRDLRTGAMFEEQQREAVTLPTVTTTRVACKSTPPLPQRWEPAPVPPPRIYPPPLGKVDSVEYRAIVGYLGTIEMPRELQPGSRLQVVRGCIKRLRAEKRAHTLVLMSVGTRSLVLTNCNQSILAEYPAERVTFCGSSSYDEQKYFGLVTSANVDTDDSGESVPSSSCHVFAVEPSLHGSHSQHSVKADTFKLCCGVDPVSGLCREFPGSSESVILAVRTLYVGREGSTQEEHLVANSPQPSNAGSTATTTSSNSDSGIGFRDDCGGNQSDRILVVDVRNQRLHIQTECQYGDGNPRLNECQHADRRLTVRAMPDPVVSSRSRSPLSCSSSDDRAINKRKTKPRLEPYSERAVDYDYTSMVTQSNDNMSISSETNKSQDAMDAMSVQSCQSQDPLLSYKLSPKVFGVPHPVTHSLEDLKGAEGPTQQWGSLQDLRTSSPQHLTYNSTTALSRSFCSKRVLPLLARHSSEHGGDLTKHPSQDSRLVRQESELGVTSWSTSLEKLLEDPLGLHTFAEFLKKEFSHENIYFWVACERYRGLQGSLERKSAAREIFDRHLCLGALEPVNVDSHARQVTQEGLEEASQQLFLQAQKQIFNLMKFDSYPRFIKSALYKECMVRQLSGESVQYPGGNQELHIETSTAPSTPTSHSKLTKSRSDAEDRRRKSLLPWNRKTRSKSKDRGETEYQKLQSKPLDDALSVRSDVTSSRSSLASWDLALRGSFSRQSTSGECALCRVFLPDGATTVVQTKPHETVRDLVIRLLDKRGLHFSAFEVFVDSSLQPICLDEESRVLGRQEVQIEQRVVFRLDLPNRKTIGVKAKPKKRLSEVLRPILYKYNYRLDCVTLCLMSENEVIEPDTLAGSVDNQRLQVLTRSSEGWKTEVSQKIKSGPTLDEITNRVFEELLQGKAARITTDQESVRSDDWESENSSGIFGRFVHRESALVDKDMHSKIKKTGVKPTSEDCADGSKTVVTKPPPLIAKWKVGVKLQGRSESDELYEGLKRAQRCRLEDQRGTEINFELPDFLKDKENAPQAGKKLRKLLHRVDETTSKFYDHLPHSSHSKGSRESLSAPNESFLGDGVIPPHRQAEEYFFSRSTPPGFGPSHDKVAPFTSTEDESKRGSDPPPLPPKPKHLPVWGRTPAEITNNARFLRPADVKRDTRVCRNRRAVYLDEPSSSFV